MAEARALSADEWNRIAAPSLEQVFADDDPYREPFTEGVERRMVLFPIAHELEEGQFDALARAASAYADDHFYFFTEQQSTVDPMEDSSHPLWSIPFDYEAYSAVGAIDVSALCSPSGRWGILVSNDSHAVVGGPAAFIEHLLNDFPPTREPVTHWHVEMPPDTPTDMSQEETLELMHALKKPMRAGVPPGDGQVQALLEFWSFFRDQERRASTSRVGGIWRRSSNPESGRWVPGVLSHLYGKDAAAEYLVVSGWQ